MKPRNFPQRKNARRVVAKTNLKKSIMGKRIKTSRVHMKELATLNQRIISTEQALSIKSKKTRVGPRGGLK